MAKVLLINSNRFKHPWPVIPFGLCYVATMLEMNGYHKVRFLDLCFSPDCESDIRKTIRSFIPDIIGISIRNIDDTGGYDVRFLLKDVKEDVIDCCKKEFSGPIVIGGPAVGISGAEMLEYFDLEYAICGDGEAVMPEFVNRIENKLSPEGIKGLIIRKNNVLVQEEEPYRVRKLDSIPFPKPSHYINLESYRRFGSPLHVQTKRGCAFRCSYCTYNRIEGRQYRLRNPRLIADEIEILVNDTGIRHIEFTDSIFNIPLSHTKEVLREVIGRKLNLRLHTMGLSPSAVDEELLDLMVRAGFNEIDIGAESLCDEILKDLAKDFKKSDVIKTAELLKRKNIPATWFIILGSPEESRETVLETLNTIVRIASTWDLIFVSTGIRVYKGAKIADELIKASKHISNDNFLRPVKVQPFKITLGDIHNIAMEFSFSYPNIYLYEIKSMVPGWAVIAANSLLRFVHSRQPVWRLLIFLKKIEQFMGIMQIKRSRHALKKKRAEKNEYSRGFSLISQNNQKNQYFTDAKGA